VFNVFEAEDHDRLCSVLEAMLLLEDDYLGGLGSRGSGKIKFENLKVYARKSDDYGTPNYWKGEDHTFDSVSAALEETEESLAEWLSTAVPVPPEEETPSTEESEQLEEPGAGTGEMPGEE
jgi:CRISPR/Cas system CSM-associated protein Csm3 (group 7 of RAMP superfamily)